MPQVQLDPRFHGPPHSANGGYACGLLAGLAEVPVAVSLRVPPPLGRSLTATVDDAGRVHLHDGDTLVAEARPTDPVPEAPPAEVTVEQARAASQRFIGFEDHLFPTCWTCGPDRPAGDGLRIFTGPVQAAGAGTGLVAAVWTPDPELGDGDGNVVPEHVWAALDCPSYFGSAAGEPALLARLAADLAGPVRIGEPHVVLGWTTAGPEGRKRHGASAVLGADGTVLASSSALWVTLSAEALATVLAPA